ncbi:MAG: phosphate propanoyltransferase [Lawsonibacter sp.]|nr:phosphate propanoyltransferase [Lawsonibacter sp.]
MHYYSEPEIRSIIESVVTQAGGLHARSAVRDKKELPIPVEVSARHVHLTQEAVECLFGSGHQLTKKRDLSQHGEFLSEERVKIVTAKGEFGNIAVLGPIRSDVQVELSMTDCKTLGIQAPINLSGNLEGAANVVLIGPCGIYQADHSAIVAKAHIHMTAQDAAKHGVHDGQAVRVTVQSARPATLEDVIIRIKDTFALTLHVDFDEANAMSVSDDTTCAIC